MLVFPELYGDLTASSFKALSQDIVGQSLHAGLPQVQHVGQLLMLRGPLVPTLQVTN